MTLPSSGHQTRAVTFGCMAKGKGISSRANLLISAKILVGNAVISGHQAKEVSSSSDLVVKRNKRKIRQEKGLEKQMHPWWVQLASYKGTHRQHQPLVLLWLDIPKNHIISLHMAWMILWGNFPFLVGISPIGCPFGFLIFVQWVCVMSLSS